MHMNDPVTSSKRRRREHSPKFKVELVARSLVPGASVSAIALEAGISANLLFAWRRMYGHARAEELRSTSSDPSSTLLPVTIEAPLAAAPMRTGDEPRQSAGTIEIDVGGARVRLRGTVDEANVRSVLAALVGAAK